MVVGHAQRVLVPGAVMTEKRLVMSASDMWVISSPNAACSTISTDGALGRPTGIGDEARNAASNSESLPSKRLGRGEGERMLRLANPASPARSDRGGEYRYSDGLCGGKYTSGDWRTGA